VSFGRRSCVYATRAMRAAPRTAAKAGRTPAGTPTAWPALGFVVVELDEVDPEPVVVAFVVGVVVVPGEVAVLLPVEVGAVEVAGVVVPEVGTPVRQESPSPVVTVKEALVPGTPLVSLILKRSEAPTVALTVHVTSVPVTPLKLATGVVPGGSVTTVTK